MRRMVVVGCEWPSEAAVVAQSARASMSFTLAADRSCASGPFGRKVVRKIWPWFYTKTEAVCSQGCPDDRPHQHGIFKGLQRGQTMETVFLPGLR